MPRSPGHVFYDRLQGVLIDAGFNSFAEATCNSYYAAKMGAPSIPPGRYFRMHMVGYFEGIDSERGIEWRCSDSLSLREFLRLRTTERVPDHSWLSKTRSRLPHEVHERVFGWVLLLIAEHGLVNGERIGVDASTMKANAALGTIVQDGTTHLAYKPEHAVDLDTGAVVAAEIHPADVGDTTTLSGTLKAAAANLAKDRAPSTTVTAELVADKILCG
jgi:transposase